MSRYPVVRYSLLRSKPQTGRKHQLRRHMKYIHHYMIGDTKHGRGEHNKLFREEFVCHRLLLHAHKIDFLHPVSQIPVCIEAKLDGTFLRLFKKFG